MKMFHPELTTLAQCDEFSFAQMWEPRGWKLVSAEAVFASDILGKTVTDVEDLTVEELKHLTRYRGCKTSAAKKADALKDFLGSFGEVTTDIAPVEPTAGFVSLEEREAQIAAAEAAGNELVKTDEPDNDVAPSDSTTS